MTITEPLTTVQAQRVLRAHGLDLSQKVVRGMIRSGELRGEKRGARYYCDRRQVEALGVEVDALA
jgi:hypothetical protein